MVVTVDNYTRILLTVIAVLLSFIGVALWCDTPTTIPSAYGKIPDSGQQREALIQKSDEIINAINSLKETMTSGQMKVQVVAPEARKKSLKTQATPKSAADLVTGKK